MIITHETLGEAYSQIAKHFFGKIPDYLQIVGVEPEDCADTIETKVAAARSHLHCGKLLILTDIFGATPCNVARRLVSDSNIAMLSGVNAPMMVKAVQYAPKSENLAAFTQMVKEAGITGIMQILSEKDGVLC